MVDGSSARYKVYRGNGAASDAMEMEQNRVIIKLDGTVSVADFRAVVDGFSDLLFALTAETSLNAAVDWVVDGLDYGSASITSRGTFGNVEGRATVEAVVSKYANVAAAANEGKMDRFSDPVREAMLAITGVINGRIPRVLMGTPDEPEMGKIEQPLKDLEYAARVQAQPRPYTRASVKGQIVTLDEKHSLYFTLQEAYTQRHVRCWPSKAHRAKLGEYWSTKTWIVVEGTFMRYGEKPSLTRITDIVELPKFEKGGWRQAIGAAPRMPDALNLSPADAVRKVRDAEA